VQQEALEPEHPCVVQRSQLGDIAGDRAAPEADVDVRLPLGGLPLQLQRGHVAGRRNAVQRHVDDRGDASGGGRAGRAGEPFPLGPARVVDVHVGVDDTRHQHLVVAQPHLLGGLQLRPVRRHHGDPAALDADGKRRLTRGTDHPASLDD
jgi:hypothetical protein